MTCPVARGIKKTRKEVKLCAHFAHGLKKIPTLLCDLEHFMLPKHSGNKAEERPAFPWMWWPTLKKGLAEISYPFGEGRRAQAPSGVPFLCTVNCEEHGPTQGCRGNHGGVVKGFMGWLSFPVCGPSWDYDLVEISYRVSIYTFCLIFSPSSFSIDFDPWANCAPLTFTLFQNSDPYTSFRLLSGFCLFFFSPWRKHLQKNKHSRFDFELNICKLLWTGRKVIILRGKCLDEPEKNLNVFQHWT